eukprot:COSAG02_NODE_6070_length_3826_cov_2.878723_2_plen_103_part_00
MFTPCPVRAPHHCLHSIPGASLEPDAVVYADGGIETKSAQSLAYLTRFNLELQKAGSRGLSILVSAGDSGVGCDGKAYQPIYPASFPAMTTVGGTRDAETVS